MTSCQGCLKNTPPPKKKKRGRRNSSHNKTRGNYDSCYEIIIKKRNIDIFVDQKFEESGYPFVYFLLKRAFQ